MAVNQKAVKVLNKVLEAGFTDEKAIAAMTMDDILSMQGITVADITLIIKNCSVSQTAERSLSQPLGERNGSIPAASLMNTIPKSAAICTTSASLPSVCRKTGRPMSRNLRNKRRRKHRSTRI